MRGARTEGWAGTARMDLVHYLWPLSLPLSLVQPCPLTLFWKARGVRRAEQVVDLLVRGRNAREARGITKKGLGVLEGRHRREKLIDEPRIEEAIRKADEIAAWKAAMIEFRNRSATK